MADPVQLTEQQRDHYCREGYVVVERFFGPDILADVDTTVRQLTDEALAGDDYRAVLELEPAPLDGRPVPRRIYDPFEQHELFRRLACDECLLDCVETLIGPNINLQHSKLNMKPPQIGSVVEWHQDLAYFPHTNDSLVSLLIYLDDATENNGCLRVLPRHHTHFFDHDLPDGSFAGMITEELDDGRFGRPVSLPAPAGSVIFMHCITPHSSLPNQSDRPRRTLIFEYRATDSFPIYFSKSVQRDEAKSPLLRGRPAKFARFGGPAPLIPNMNVRQSLYELQNQSKAILNQT